MIKELPESQTQHDAFEETVRRLADEADNLHVNREYRDISFARLLLSDFLKNVNQWRNIESAPKDGTKILLASIGLNEVGEDLGIWWATSGFWSAKWLNWNDGVEPCGLHKPTHWIHLPQPPRKEE